MDGKLSEACPKCGSLEVVTKVRQYPDLPGLVDVGFKCSECGEEWGFEVAQDVPGMKSSQAS